MNTPVWQKSPKQRECEVQSIRQNLRFAEEDLEIATKDYHEAWRSMHEAAKRMADETRKICEYRVALMDLGTATGGDE